MQRWSGKVAIVTGASSGIGAAICEKLVEAGCKVVGLARRVENVENLAKTMNGKPGSLYGVKADITCEEDVINAFEWTKNNVGDVHILVNNAGCAQVTNLIDGDVQKWKTVLDTNILGLCIATREACRSMRANKVDGHIVHINSIAGHCHPYYSILNVYAASKHAVTNLTETLRKELWENGSRTKITSVSPGAVKTEFFDRALSVPFVQERMKTQPFLSAQDVADAVLYALGTPPNVQIQEVVIKPLGSFY